ncbi:inovirus Gp2 family protein [Vibrio cholerae]|nr:inovirus Gp2 family protein [Vibrio cholerae]
MAKKSKPYHVYVGRTFHHLPLEYDPQGLLYEALGLLHKAVQSTLSAEGKTSIVRYELTIPTDYAHSIADTMKLFGEKLKATVDEDLSAKKTRLSRPPFVHTMTIMWSQQPTVIVHRRVDVAILMNAEAFERFTFDFKKGGQEMRAAVKRCWEEALAAHCDHQPTVSLHTPLNSYHTLDTSWRDHTDRLRVAFFCLSKMARMTHRVRDRVQIRTTFGGLRV